MTGKIDFKQVAAAALNSIDSLLSAWLPGGKREGHEFKALNPTRTDNRPGSFAINLKTGAWADFADSSPDAKGGDLISLYAYLHGLDQLDAAREVAAQLGFAIDSGALRSRPAQASEGVEMPSAKPQKRAPEAVGKKKEDAGSEWVAVLPVPDDAPEPPVAHRYRGIPSRRWTYRDAAGKTLGFVCRFETSDGGKETLPLTFCRNEKTGAHDWRWLSFSKPRPLYGLDRLAECGNYVILVEGEKCADAAQEQLPKSTVITWPGGCKAVDMADWSALAGRKVISWADCDSQREKLTKQDKDEGLQKEDKPFLPPEKQPGIAAMAKIREKALALGARWWDVKIPAPGEKPDGWDVADAIEEGLRGEDLAQFIRDNMTEYTVAEPIPTASEAAAVAAEESPAWIPDLIYKKGELAACLSNVYQILSHRMEWHGVIAYDEFALRVVKRKEPMYAGGTLGEWTDVDDSRTAMWLSREYGFTPSSALVSEAVRTLAMAHAFHPVRDYLTALTWDGIERLDHWLIDHLGATDREYARLVGRWWLMGAVKRVLQPGCKFDYCLVLEGAQGKKKSSAFSVLGGDWFGDTDLDFANKDSMIALSGKLIYELAELGALARTDERRQKSFLSRRYDEFRPPYGRTYIKSPRQLVFGGSTNEWEWNKDPTGGRRFWPIECGEINVEALIDARDQLFAEAYHRVMAGDKYWPDADEQKKLFDPEQLRVEQPDGFIDVLHDWVDDQVQEFTLAKAIMDGLNLDASKMTRDLQTRVGIALRKLGCDRVERRNGTVRFLYKPPVRNGATSTNHAPAVEAGAPAQPSWGSDDEPF